MDVLQPEKSKHEAHTFGIYIFRDRWREPEFDVSSESDSHLYSLLKPPSSLINPTVQALKESGEISCPMPFPLGRNRRIYLLGGTQLKVVNHESYRFS